MSLVFYKRDSHRMMNIMWGDSPSGRKRAYIWLAHNLGYQIHFSTSRPNEIKDAHKALFGRMIKKGFDYMEPDEIQTLHSIENPKKKKRFKKRKFIQKFGRIIRLQTV